MLAPFLLLSALAAPAPVTLVQDPAQLSKLTLPLSRFFSAEAGDNSSLYSKSAQYRIVADSLSQDLADLKAKDPRLDVTMAKIHRLFAAGWLKSPSARFELVGVVNRLDRQPFHPEKCGEVRLVYRLSYEKSKDLRSRLPMTVNVVHWVEGDCQAAAKSWSESDLAGPKGPLSPERLAPAALKSIEVNLQSVRWPSTTRGDLGGHAEYLVRVFKPAGRTLVLDRLENTPDVARLSAQPKGKAKLKEWIQQNLARLDEGTAVVPAEFLAVKATSVSPRGLARLANRPFSRLFTEKDFSALDFSNGKFVRSPKALLRRLDDLSCIGCHQGRTVAGFHLLGIDGPETLTGNAIAVSGSPHLLGDQPRRRRFVEALASGSKPDPARPLSEAGDGGYGSHCGLGDPGFADWKCASGLHCRAIGLAGGDDTVGQCFPKAPEAGDPCEVGKMIPDADPHKDRVIETKQESCGSGLCESTPVGFPDGMCARACDSPGPHQRCGSIAILAGFNGCLGAGKPFPTCLKQHVRPAGLRACGDDEPCRDDYLCTRADSGGVCLPPYFLFQMRVDGHPKP